MINLTTMKYSFKHENINCLITSCWPLFLSAFTFIFIGIGLRDPWPADEPRFALIAKEMVETGQWFFPARAQELYPDKPPIFMWSIALCYWLFGSIRLSFLLPSAVSGLLTIFLVYDIGKRLWTKKIGLVAGWLLLFSFQFLLQAKTAQIDAMVCAWITIGCYGLLRYCLVDGNYKWYALAWFSMGIGVITKGVGFLPALMLIPYGILRFKSQFISNVTTTSAWGWISGILIMLGAISLWFIPMLLLVAQSDNSSLELYRDNILLKQTVTRYADSWHHIKPAWYYVTAVIPLFWLPLSLMLPWLVKPWLVAFKHLDARIVLPVSWVILVIIFFSLSPGKRGVYILPALPMLVLAIAPYYQALSQKKGLKLLLLVISLLLSGVLSLLAILGLLDVSAITKLVSKIDVEPWYLFLTIGLSSLSGIWFFYRYSKWYAWPVFFSALWLTYSTYGYILRNNVSTPINIYERAEQQINKDSEIALVSFSEQFILFSPYRVYHFGYHTALEYQLEAAYQWLSNDRRFVLIAEKQINTECFDMKNAIKLGVAHRRNWVLLPFSAKRDTCSYKNSEVEVFTYKAKNI